MKRIWKYQFGQNTKLLIPGFQRLLSAEVQDGEWVFWAIVDPDKANVRVEVVTVVTGGPLPPDSDSYTYGATFQDGWFVGHAFWRVGT